MFDDAMRSTSIVPEGNVIYVGRKRILNLVAIAVGGIANRISDLDVITADSRERLFHGAFFQFQFRIVGYMAKRASSTLSTDVAIGCYSIP